MASGLQAETNLSLCLFSNHGLSGLQAKDVARRKLPAARACRDGSSLWTIIFSSQQGDHLSNPFLQSFLHVAPAAPSQPDSP